MWYYVFFTGQCYSNQQLLQPTQLTIMISTKKKKKAVGHLKRSTSSCPRRSIGHLSTLTCPAMAIAEVQNNLWDRTWEWWWEGAAMRVDVTRQRFDGWGVWSVIHPDNRNTRCRDKAGTTTRFKETTSSTNNLWYLHCWTGIPIRDLNFLCHLPIPTSTTIATSALCQ